MEKKNPAVLYGEVVAKCWEDEEYKKHFVEDPESVLVEAGIPVEEGVTYKVIEAPKLVEYIVLPDENVQPVIQMLAKRLLNKAEKSDEILPEGTEVRLIQNTEDTRYLVLPASPKSLTKAELKSIFGGDTSVEMNTVAVQTGVVVTTGGEAVEVATTEVQTAETTTTAFAEAEVAAVAIGIIVLI